MNLTSTQVVKSMPSSSPSVGCKAGDGVSDEFPAGLRVLLVDDDPTCLRILEKMLRTCLYEVTKCNRAEIALSHLRENKNGFDIVISDVHMPDVDGFKLLECIGLEMDLPVIMMSADDSKSVVMKGVTHGACDYLIKPVRIEALKNIWQHVVRKKKHEWKDCEQPDNAESGDRQQKSAEETDYMSSANEGNWRNSKRRKDEEDEAEEREDTSALKRPRVVWSVELHQQFVAAVNQLGIDKAVPKKILDLMNVPGLTRENVASHLQKYRLYLRRVSGVSKHQNGLNNTFVGSTDGTFASMSSLNGLDFQALAATGQLRAQSLATIQASLGRSTTKSAISIPLVDQRNLFSFGNPRLKFEESQQQLNNNMKEINLLHGVPMNMEMKHLNSLGQSIQPFGAANIQINSHGSHGDSLPLQMTQAHSRPRILNEANGNAFSSRPSSTGQTALSNGISSGVFAQNGTIDNHSEVVYNQVSQASPMVDFSIDQGINLPENNFSFGSSLGMSTVISQGLLQDNLGSELNGSRGLDPSYDIFNDLHQHRPEDWNLPNLGLPFDVSQQANVQGNAEGSPSLLVQQGFSSQKSGQNTGTSLEKAIYLSGEERRNSNVPIISQQPNTLISGNSPSVKPERIVNPSSHSTLLSQQFGEDDLMSALLKQEEGIGPVESDFGFDGCQVKVPGYMQI